jgi:hypothetical protein
MNPAYKHIRDRMRIGELTVPQIISLFCGFMGGLVFALYLSPFGSYLTLFVAIYIATIPTGAVLMASRTPLDQWLYLRAAIHDHASDGRYIPGAGETCEGYAIEADEDGLRFSGRDQPKTVDLGAIWDF